MSAVLETIRALLAGDPAPGDALLPACRAEAFGAEAFGGAAIAELFATFPHPLSPAPHLIETAQGLALFDADEDGREQAVIADLFDGRIGRLWRVGPDDRTDDGAATLSPAAEPRMEVAFDPFISQARSPPPPSATDHPELDPDARPALQAVVHEAALGFGPRRACVLVLRAFAVDGRGAVLLAAQCEAAGPTRRIETTPLAAAFRYGADGARLHGRLVTDGSPAPPAIARLPGLARE